MATIEDEIFAQHAVEAAFLWTLRDAAASAPGHDLGTLAALDERVEAHVDGLRLAGDAGLHRCEAALDGGEAGEVFAATVVAVERCDVDALARVLDVAGATPALSRGVVSALGWGSFEVLSAILPALLDSHSPPELQRLGIAGCAAHRRDPGAPLADALVSSDAGLRARALRAVGELGRKELLPDLVRALGSAEEDCRFFAAWSGAVLGDRAAVEVLMDLAARSARRAVAACAMAVRRMDAGAARSCLASLAGAAGRVRAALAGAAALGDPGLVPWILEHVEAPASARAAGAALALITGIDLRRPEHRRAAPKGLDAGPADERDEGLLWPDPGGVRAWWAREGARFEKGTRFLSGRPMTDDWLKQVLRVGNQPARAAAAVEVALRTPGQAVFEVRAPGFRQQAVLR